MMKAGERERERDKGGCERKRETEFIKVLYYFECCVKSVDVSEIYEISHFLNKDVNEVDEF